MFSSGLQCQVETRVIKIYFQKHFVRLRSCTTRTWCLKGESAWQAHLLQPAVPTQLALQLYMGTTVSTRQELHKCLLQDQHALLAPMLKRECMGNAQ